MVVTFPATAQERMLLHHGHSHNDYKQKRPLFDALDHGYTSIEVDIFSYKGSIRVSHVATRLRHKPDLESLYLEPLNQVIEENGGLVFAGDSTTLVLMIDLKSDKIALIGLLQAALQPYSHLIRSHNSTEWKPLSVVLSGGPPRDMILQDDSGIFGMDGKFMADNSQYSSALMPRLSSNYRSHFKWQGKGQMPVKEQELLKDLVMDADNNNRKVRFWNCPENEMVWKTLLDAGVEWINVDDLKRFRKFYLEKVSRHN